jgi:hypothetical protein
MNFKVVRNHHGDCIAFGPNVDQYEPGIPQGCVLSLEETEPAPLEPSPLEKIRALEAQYADAQAKVTRQLALKALLDEAATYPQAAGLTRDQVHTVLMTNTESTYAKLFDLEAEVEKLRAQL